MSRTTDIVCAALVALVCGGIVLPAPAAAMPPPVDRALEWVGEDRDAPRDENWSLTTVTDDGPTTLCGQSGSDGESVVFSNGETVVEVGPDAQPPWNLVWAVLWANSPDDLLNPGEHGLDDETGRVETFDDELVFCWGEDQRLCVDEPSRRIVVLRIDVEDTRWGLRVTGGGQQLQVTEDGAPVARFSQETDECP